MELILIIILISSIMISVKKIRVKLITPTILKLYKKSIPKLSDTEKDALNSGTSGEIESAIFSGRVPLGFWDKPASERLTDEEQKFIKNEVEQACLMVNDWEVTAIKKDLSEELWNFLKTSGFFGMVIPKQYGGKGFSAYAHHMVISKLSSVSSTLGVTVGVPNSLGPGELILHYGTDDQKNNWLPKLANGQEIPCFGLTGPFAGSDATSIPDKGIIVEVDGKIFIEMTIEKRYITLAPVATIIGIAFKLFDPNKLLSDDIDRGISIALVKRDTAGLEIGRRHDPLGAAFMNGPITGKILIPVEDIIGGEAGIGKGWKMLVECLSVGRSITLPSMSAGSSAITAAAVAAYADVRKQFNHSINKFEGVETALAEIAVKTVTTIALSRQAAITVDDGYRPAVASAIAKQRCTELSRQIIGLAMDVEGGKGIILGPKNHLGRLWQCAPISITVEGANIMTRSLMIFGQGVFMSHPYIQKGLASAESNDIDEFDNVITGHAWQVFENVFKSMKYCKSPETIFETRKNWEVLAAQTSLLADLSLLSLGGKLKIKERISGHMADAVSGLYAAAAIDNMASSGLFSKDDPVIINSIRSSLEFTQEALDKARKHHVSKISRIISSMARFPIKPDYSMSKNLDTYRKLSNKIIDKKLFSKWYSQRRDAGHPAGRMLDLHDLIKSGCGEPEHIREMIDVDSF